MKKIKLNELLPYAAATVVSAAGEGLETMGFTEGVRVVRLYDAPCGDPTAYDVGGTVIAVRGSDAEKITVMVSGVWA